MEILKASILSMWVYYMLIKTAYICSFPTIIWIRMVIPWFIFQIVHNSELCIELFKFQISSQYFDPFCVCHTHASRCAWIYLFGNGVWYGTYLWSCWNYCMHSARLIWACVCCWACSGKKSGGNHAGRAISDSSREVDSIPAPPYYN